MKRIFFLAISVLVSVGAAVGQGDSNGMVAAAGAQDAPVTFDKTAAELWDDAGTAYVNADYEQAVALYKSILSQGFESSALFYNLGNSYFKMGMNAEAILNYNRALRLAPSDDDIKYNLSIANAYTRDKIDVVPEFFMMRWMRDIKSSMSSNSWAGISIATFALLLVCGILYLLMGSMALRKAGFYAGMLCLAIFIASTGFAGSQKNRIIHPDEAVVISGSVPVKSSPDAGSKDIFVLHSGTKVKVTVELNGWREVMIPNGNKGWLQASSIEMI